MVAATTVAATAAMAATTDGNRAAFGNVVLVNSSLAMKRTTLGISSLALAALLTGCVGTGPNTQQGAVTGATLGAITGAIIGNNTHGSSSGEGALWGALAGGLLGGTVGNAQDHENGTVYGYPKAQSATYYRTTYAQTPPPAAPAPLTDVVTPSPAPNALWVPGYWDFNGTGYAWTAGHWEIPPPMSTTYVASHWETRNGANVFVRGYWR
jgi:uncharacterized protein YcfJ